MSTIPLVYRRRFRSARWPPGRPGLEHVVAALDNVGGRPHETGMVIITNRIPVAEGHEIDFEDRFRRRIGLVDQSPGFIRNEVHRPKPMKLDHETGEWGPDPDAQGYYEVKTWWRSFDDFVAWTKSESFREAHRSRAPKEMFSGPNVLEVHELFLSTDLDADG